MKIKILVVVLLLAATAVKAVATQKYVYDIRKSGAKGDGKTLCTDAINKAIGECSAAGGGVVLVPKGTFVTGTVHLKDNVRLYLEAGAVLKATTELDKYEPYIPTHDMSRFDSGDGTQNSNNSRDRHWNRTLILGVGIQNASIEGEGIIDGIHLFDPQGEEKMRGPHTVLIAESRNFLMSGVTVNNAANYAFMAYDIANCTFNNLQMNEGWDGIHIRGGRDIVIRNCEFRTGDDAIAGGYWENMVITDCYINSSCNGIRVIMPVTDMTVSHCVFEGPGRYPHRTSKELNRTNMLSAIIIQPGGWGRAVGNIENIRIHDIEIRDLGNPLMIVLNEGNEGCSISVERVRATGLYHAAASIESWRGGMFENVILRDISFSYVGNGNPAMNNIHMGQPPADSRPIPCWGWYVRNVRNVLFENIELDFEGEETRPAFLFDNVAVSEFRKVTYKTSQNQEGVIRANSGSFITEL